MRFAKWHGIGNDYILVREQELPLRDDGSRGLDEADARLLCDRHFGIGADGILVLGGSDIADARMTIFNPDGSLAEMCGNGIRMAARFLHGEGIIASPEFTIETAGGIMRPRVNDDGTVRVDMGIAVPGDVEEVAVPGHGSFRGRSISMGNPHFVVARPPEQVQVGVVGPLLERHDRFAPARTNVEFIDPVGHLEVRMRVWERGVGETLACGTGACAVAVAAVLDHGADGPLTIHLAGGDLLVEVDPGTLHVHMTGAAAQAYAGDLDLDAVRAAAPSHRFAAADTVPA